MILPLAGKFRISDAMLSGTTTTGTTQGLQSLMQAAPDAFINVTAAPYYADPTGETDSTAAICRAYSDIMQPGADAFAHTCQLLAAGATIEGSLEADPNHPLKWILCPHVTPPTRILYFPPGLYRVSNTLVYDNEALHTTHLDELCRCIHWLGAGSDKVTIQLAPNSPGFEAGEERPVVQFCPGRKSSVAMQNTFEGIAVEVGEGNPGAVGIAFFANNTGAMRDVRVTSTGPSRSGFAGVAILDWNSSCAFIQNLTVTGFEYGLCIRHPRLYTVAENITVRQQLSAGVYVSEHNVALRGLNSTNTVPALRVTGKQAVVQIVDSTCQTPASGSIHSAIDFRDGQLHARDVTVSGYHSSLNSKASGEVLTGSISSYSSCQVFRLFKKNSAQPLRIPVEETPRIPLSADPANWIAVTTFGAVADGKIDCTTAIQSAFHSGSSHICFPPGRYLIDGVIEIPATVQRINFLYADLVSGQRLREGCARSCFRISEDSDQQLIMEDLFAWVAFAGPFRLIEHAAKRDLILSDIHTQEIPCYFNSVPGSRVFIENCACTSQSAPGLSGFAFTGQNVWARQLNPERAPTQVRINGGRFWCLGFKVENPCTGFHALNQAEADIIGGIFNQYRYADGKPSPPLVLIEDASLSISASTTDFRTFVQAMTIVRESQNGVVKELAWEMLPNRTPHLVSIPLFVSRHL